jgi:neutral trehalase
MARRTLTFTAICAVLVCTGVAHAQTGEQLSSSWANTNVCNATQLGARAQLAGDGSKSDLSARFTAQWLSPDGWVPLQGAATSPWQSAGSAEYTWGQAGWTFSISVPPGHQYQLRTVAELRWSGATTRSETHTTATCTIGAN